MTCYVCVRCVSVWKICHIFQWNYAGSCFFPKKATGVCHVYSRNQLFLVLTTGRCLQKNTRWMSSARLWTVDWEIGEILRQTQSLLEQEDNKQLSRALKKNLVSFVFWRKKKKKRRKKEGKNKKNNNNNNNNNIHLTVGTIYSLIRSIPFFTLKHSCFIKWIWYWITYTFTWYNITSSFWIWTII